MHGYIGAVLCLLMPMFSLDVQARDQLETPKSDVEIRGFNKGSATVRGYFDKALTTDISLGISAFKARGWDEVTVGPTYYINPEMSAGLGLGASFYRANNENAKSAHQTVSGFWYWKTNGWEAEILMERYSRDSNPWYHEGYVQRRVSDGISVGLFAKKDSGWGPRLNYRVNQNLNLWVAPLVRRSGEASGIVGAIISF